MKVIKEQSLNNRYFYKLLSNIFGLVIGIITMTLVTRVLGPKDYGNFEFINSFFRELIPFFTFTASIGFFTKFSQRKNEFKLIIFFKYLLIFGMSLLIFFVFLSFYFEVSDILWRDQSNLAVLLGMVLCILIVFTTFLSQISDAIGITISLEVIKTIQKFIGLIMLIFLSLNDVLNFYNFYLYNIFIQILLFILIAYILRKVDFFIFDKWFLSIGDIKKYSIEFYSYSQPLFMYAIFGVVVGIFDRWILQVYGGSEQQAYFSLGQRIGTICFLFTSSMSTLITREFSISYFHEDLGKMKNLFRRYVPILYSTAAFFSCFVFINAENIILLISGNSYSGAIIPLMILALFPIHQTYGQLNGAVFYSMNKTRVYTNIGLFFMLVGAFTSFFLLAPKSFHGFNLGSTGLAAKVLFMQFLHVNVQLYYNSKFLKMNFYKYFFHQIIIVVIFLSIALSVKILFDSFIDFNILVRIFLSGILYVIITFFGVILLPRLFGLLKKDILILKNRLKGLMK